ncbi:MAG: protein kinase domain-containing protein, partial [bacterium]
MDHYQLLELIGGGGMGAVFRASDTRLDREVAVKVIPNLGRDLEALRRFRVEAQSAARLDHPRIARVYHVGETEAWNYIVFEFI